MPRSKANLNFVFFILRTFFVLKGGWGTATEKNGTKSVVKFVAGPIRNFGNIAGALNSNIPLGPDFAHGLAAMRIELTAYIFTAGLAFNMATYQPIHPPPSMRVYM